MDLALFNKEVMIEEMKKRKDCYVWDGICAVPRDVGYVIIMPGVTEIGKGAFENCVHMTKVDIPDSVTTIGKAAFQNCTSLKKVEIPSSVMEIDKDTFSFCDSLADVHIPEGITVIGRGAFSNCNSLVTLTVPSSVTLIGTYAFAFCKRLENCNILATSPGMCEDLFKDCPALNRVVVPGSNYDSNNYKWC